MKRSPGLAVAAIALGSLSSCARSAELSLKPNEWNFGAIEASSPIEQELRLANPGNRPIPVRFFSTCTCLTVEPDRLELEGRGGATVVLRYNPSEDEGDVVMQVIVRYGAGKTAVRRKFEISGRVLHDRAKNQEQAQLPTAPAASQAPQLAFEYYYDPGCKGCELFLVRHMIALQQELGIRLKAARHDIRQPEVHRRYLQRLEELGVEERAYPAVVLADRVLQGEKQIEREFKNALLRHLGRKASATEP